MSNPQKKKKNKPTVKQARAIKELMANVGISVAEAKRRAGYSESEARNPQRLTQSSAYIEIMNRNGLDDESIAKAHRDLVEATVLKEKEFFAEKIETTIDPDAEDGSGIEVEYRPVSDEKIKSVVQKSPGCELVEIIDYGSKKIAYFLAPECIAKKGGVELAYKSKGHMAPEKHEHEVSYDATPSEKDLISKILGQDNI